eukprot:5647632-Prymnesium_polylepis.1
MDAFGGAGLGRSAESAVDLPDRADLAPCASTVRDRAFNLNHAVPDVHRMHPIAQPPLVAKASRGRFHG